AAALLSKTLKDIGIYKSFAPLIVVLGHGATSVNNPFAAAYNCGACGGRDGGPNARLVASLINNPAIRKLLAENHDIVVPDDTVFVGGLHNTTTDEIELFDTDAVPASHQERLAEAQRIFRRAAGENALERCMRFLLAKNVKTPEEALRHVYRRAT